jgi:hypothetical protein
VQAVHIDKCKDEQFWKRIGAQGVKAVAVYYTTEQAPNPATEIAKARKNLEDACK